MDFIKTSSPCALTLSSIRVLNRAHRPIEEQTYRDCAAQIIHVPLSPRPFPRTDPGGIIPWSANSLPHDHPCTTAPREQEGKASRPRHNPCTAADPSAQAGRQRPMTGQVSSAKTYPSVRPRRPNTKTVGHDRSDRTDSRLRSDDRPIIPTDCPNAAIDLRPFLKPVTHEPPSTY
ncbi:unnamed protein product [Microthlaspi erraticum]|uniref:Uncharacterized protein n=1 Tax=Microthlaspi erraticum TaxID=1685480 RepID=A0A6D2HKW3_9BRAS|nr:unnamed protein product [Microthlaspi erraticum]